MKPVTKIFVSENKLLAIKDIAQIQAPKKISNKIETAAILDIKAEKKCNFIISAIDIIRVITKTCPDARVINVGETDVIVTFDPNLNRKNPILTAVLIIFVTLTLLMGSATAIMSFHNDAQIPKIFRNYYKAFFNKESEKTHIIDIPYSLGLAFGIIVFFNHFLGKKLTEDPTPIEVEMVTYDADLNETIIDQLTEEKAKKVNDD
jgi:stage V sporulation protein AA